MEDKTEKIWVEEILKLIKNKDEAKPRQDKTHGQEKST